MGTKADRLFTVLEGPDLSGKTTIANLLSKTLSAELLRSPPPPFEKIKQSVLEEAAPSARLFYFLAANLQISSTAKEKVVKKHVVCDRYLWSTIAYHSAIENVPTQRVVRMVEPLLQSFFMPNLLVYLSVDRKTQLLRAKSRTDDKLQRALLLSETFQNRLEVAYEELRKMTQIPIIEVNTSRLIVPDTLKEVLAGIDTHRQLI